MHEANNKILISVKESAVDNVHAVLRVCDTMDDMDEIKQHAHNLQAESSEYKDARLFNEINLLRLEGYYFCLDPKDALRRTIRNHRAVNELGFAAKGIFVLDFGFESRLP
jgi:hypothetical protein